MYCILYATCRVAIGERNSCCNSSIQREQKDITCSQITTPIYLVVLFCYPIHIILTISIYKEEMVVLYIFMFINRLPIY